MSPIPKISTILYSTDLGENTRPVFRHAISQARKNEAHIVMVHVVEPLSEAAISVINTFLSHDDTEKAHKNTIKDVLEVMQKRLEAFCSDELDAANVNSSRVKEILVVGGHPSEQILRVAKERNADMIVMGRSTRSLLGNTIMGSTVRRVTKHAPVPVLVVPND
jgi:nucleotide-binding universal stress UspA family protein